MSVQKGDVFDWNGVTCYIKRVARDHTWVDMHCVIKPVPPFPVTEWDKRHPTPGGEMPKDFTKLSIRQETFIVELLLPAEITTAMAIVDLKTCISFGTARIRDLVDVTDEIPDEPPTLSEQLQSGRVTPSEAQAALLSKTVERYGHPTRQMNPGLGTPPIHPIHLPGETNAT